MRRSKVHKFLARLLVIALLMSIFPIIASAADVTIGKDDTKFSVVYDLPAAPYKYAAGQIKVTIPDGVTIEGYEWNKNFEYKVDTMANGRPQVVSGGLIHTIGFASSKDEFQSGISLTLQIKCGSTDTPSITIDSFEYQAIETEKVGIQVNATYTVKRVDDATTPTPSPSNPPGDNGTIGDGGGGGTIDIDDQETPLTPLKSKYFNDVDENWSWAYRQIDALHELGIVNGVGNRLFNPSHNIKRADFILMVVRAFELTAETNGNFDDVAPGTYYYNSVGIAKELGIAKGFGGKFNPESPISRQDMMVLVARILEFVGKPLDVASEEDIAVFSDSYLISDYAKNEVASLVQSGLIIGSNGKVNPRGNTTRAEVAVFLYRVLDYIQK